jgi:phosphopantothenoylcysteine synthetase/decarboxylase
MPEVILGITGSIAAYKAADIASQLTRRDIRVHPVMTAAATRFITPLTLQSLTGERVYTELLDDTYFPDIRHISLVREAACLVVAPASANFLSKMATGIADDMLTTIALAAHDKSIIVAPAMNTAMYTNPIIQRHLASLRDLGVTVIEPRESLLACGDYGRGALAEVADIVRVVQEAVTGGS